MNAQEQWKTWYRSKHDFHYYNPNQCRYEQRKVRREAALERLVARLQRENAAQREQINVLAMLVRLKYGNLDPDVNKILVEVGHGYSA